MLLTTFVYANQPQWDDDKINWTELDLAIYNMDNSNIVNYIHDNLEFLNEGRNATNTIEIAMRVNNEYAVYELLNSGIIFDLDELLIWACIFNSNVQIVMYLVDFGANINYVRANGYNCLMAATSFSSIEVMRYLIYNNIDVNIGRRLADGFTALTLAIYNMNFEKIEILLEAGASPCNINNTGETALNLAENLTKRLEIEQRERILSLFR